MCYISLKSKIEEWKQYEAAVKLECMPYKTLMNHWNPRYADCKFDIMWSNIIVLKYNKIRKQHKKMNNNTIQCARKNLHLKTECIEFGVIALHLEFGNEGIPGF